tara:strand:- start:572 stop:1123 length:552 start_codon:yes stop_codon:yes gene_type:complete
MIHKSHTRKDLVEVIEEFELWDIDDYSDMSKEQLTNELWDYLKKLNKVKQPDNFFIQDLEDLKKYLIKPSPRQVVSEKTKIVIMDKVRNIVYYAKHTGYFISGSNYTSLEDIQADATYISKYGDMTSVRRALRYYNADMSNPVKVDPVISRREKTRLDKIDAIKKNTKPSFKQVRGEFIVCFQ